MVLVFFAGRVSRLFLDFSADDVILCALFGMLGRQKLLLGEFSKNYKNTKFYVIPVSLTIPLSTTVFFDADCQNRSNKFEATEASKFRRDGLEPQNSKIPPVDQGYPGQKSFGKRKLNICAPRATSKENGERSLFCNPKRLDYRFHCNGAIVVLRGLNDFSQRCSGLKLSFDQTIV